MHTNTNPIITAITNATIYVIINIINNAIIDSIINSTNNRTFNNNAIINAIIISIRAFPNHTMPVAPVVQLVTSKPSDVGT